jgi:trans-2-enoyl-CoA reductase
MSSGTALSPEETLAELERARERASARADELESQQRAAAEAAALASGVVADLERRQIGGEKITAATRREAEDTLARARAEADQPWAEKIAGAQAARRDAHQRVQAYIGEHLDQLVAAEEADGELATAKLNAAAEAAIAAYSERERIASNISALASTIT